MNLAAAPRLITAREEGVQYSLADRGDELFILTNADKAIDFKIVTAPLNSPARANWRDLIPSREGIYVIDLELYSGHLVQLEHNAARHRSSATSGTGEGIAIAFDEAAYSLDAIGRLRIWTRPTLRFSYSSMTTPSEVYDYDMASRTRTLRKRRYSSGYNPADYVTTRIMAKAEDGAEVPISLLHRRDFVRDGNSAAAALRLRFLRHGDAGRPIQRQSAVAGRSRFCFMPSRISAAAPTRGWGWYLDGKARKEDEHL